MKKLYVDATVPLRWGPHPPVGIPRVESAIVRQAMRNSGTNGTRFFMINRNGEARFLDRRELAYLGDLVEGRAAAVQSAAGERIATRLKMVMQAIRSGAITSGKEFDRVSAAYLSGRNDRRGLAYQSAKTFVRAAKLLAGGRRPQPEAGPDPLADADAACFISTAGLHSLATGNRVAPIAASLATILHDLIPLEHPDLVDRSHARNFERDVDWMMKNCDRIVAISAHTAEAARSYAETHGIEVMPELAVSRLGSFLKEGLKQKPLAPVPALTGERFALYCSTIEIRKNHITLLKAWARLIPILGDRLPKLVFCGRWGWMNDEVEAWLAEHPEIASHLVLLSDMSDAELGWLYAHADFALYPSLAEGWGLSAAEALDFGLPVLISDTPSLAEATQGLMPVIASRDLDGWVAAVERAVTDRAWLDELTMRIMIGYLPISEEHFSRRVLSLVSGRAAASTISARRPSAASLPPLPRWTAPRKEAEPPGFQTMAGA